MARTITIPENLAFEAMEMFAEAAEEQREFAREWEWMPGGIAGDYKQGAADLEKRADFFREALGIDEDTEV